MGLGMGLGIGLGIGLEIECEQRTAHLECAARGAHAAAVVPGEVDALFEVEARRHLHWWWHQVRAGMLGVQVAQVELDLQARHAWCDTCMHAHVWPRAKTRVARPGHARA